MRAQATPHPALFILLTLLLLLTPQLSGCIHPQQTKYNGEVREYHGQMLSSISDFHENSIKGPQYLNSTTYRLRINGLVKTPRNFTLSDIIDNHTHLEKVATLNCVEGWSVNILWEGIPVRDLLNETTPASNATTILFTAVDGYTTSFPFSYVTDNPIMLAFKMNNLTIPSERGYPLQLVAEGKWGYKWIKWVTNITLLNTTKLSGYWENQGYSENGDLNQSFLGP